MKFIRMEHRKLEARKTSSGEIYFNIFGMPQAFRRLFCDAVGCCGQVVNDIRRLVIMQYNFQSGSENCFEGIKRHESAVDEINTASDNANTIQPGARFAHSTPDRDL